MRRPLPIRIACLAVTVALTTPAVSAADVVIDWNQVLVSALTATNTSPQNAGRIAAMTHAAIFDAVNGIDGRYEPYSMTQAGPRGASREAAAAQAAYVILKTLLPAQAAGFERQRDASIAAIEASTNAIAGGVAWGEFVATELLTKRSTDGFPAGGTPDSGSLGVGEWRPEAGLPPVGQPAGDPLARGVDPICDADVGFLPASRPAGSRKRCLRGRFPGSEESGSRDGIVTHAGTDRHRLLLDGQHDFPLEPDRRVRCSRTPKQACGKCPFVRPAQHRDGRRRHCGLGCEVLLQTLETLQRYSARRQR